MHPKEAIEHLVGLQAQNPLDPYLALWSRLESFDPVAVGEMIANRSLVRLVVMRGTIHLLSAEDALWLRPLTQPVLDAEISRHRDFAPRLEGVDIEGVLAFARAILAEGPLSNDALRSVLGQRFPDLHAAALAYACRCHLPLIQAPPRGVWGQTRQVMVTTLDTWLGKPLDSNRTRQEMALRYLRAFGPASAADLSAWSRLTGWRSVVESLRPQLVSYRSESGAELFDLPDVLLPDPDELAPIRFLPEYDNLLLSHADRSRFGSNDRRRFAGIRGPIKGTVLVDGGVQAIWRFEKKKSALTLVVEHLPQAKSELAEIEKEGGALSRFWHSGFDASIELKEIP
jgi:hypothetical protein